MIVKRSGPQESNIPPVLAQESLYRCSLQLTSISVVLTYICFTVGNSAVISGILSPLFTAGVLVGSALAPRIVAIDPSPLRVVLFSVSAMTSLMAVNALSASILWGRVVAVIFLVTVIGMGAVSGWLAIAFSEVLAYCLPKKDRFSVDLGGAAAGASLAAVAAIVIAVTFDDPIVSQTSLLWVGSVAMAMSAWACLFIRGKANYTHRLRPKISDALRVGVDSLRDGGSFRRYYLALLVCTPIGLGRTFYVIAAAHSLNQDDDGLTTLVMTTCAALVAGFLLWRVVSRYLGGRTMLMLATFLSGSAGGVIVTEMVMMQSESAPIFGFAIFLSTLAGQPSNTTFQLWMIGSKNRVFLNSFCQFSSCAATVVLGATLGAIAGSESTLWPVAILCAFHGLTILGLIVLSPSTVP